MVLFVSLQFYCYYGLSAMNPLFKASSKLSLYCKSFDQNHNTVHFSVIKLPQHYVLGCNTSNSFVQTSQGHCLILNDIIARSLFSEFLMIYTLHTLCKQLRDMTLDINFCFSQHITKSYIYFSLLYLSVSSTMA